MESEVKTLSGTDWFSYITEHRPFAESLSLFPACPRWTVSVSGHSCHGHGRSTARKIVFYTFNLECYVDCLCFFFTVRDTHCQSMSMSRLNRHLRKNKKWQTASYCPQNVITKINYREGWGFKKIPNTTLEDWNQDFVLEQEMASVWPTDRTRQSKKNTLQISTR